MSIKSRLEKAEKVRRAAEPVEFQVYLTEDDGYHVRTGTNGQVIERLSPAEWEAHKADPNVKIIEVKYNEDDPAGINEP